MQDGALIPAGLVNFASPARICGSGSTGCAPAPRPTRFGLAPVHPELVAGVRNFGRYRSGAIRDDVLLSVSCA